jgi:hypothetical protein
MKQIITLLSISVVALASCSSSNEVAVGCFESGECGPGEVCDPTSKQCIPTSSQTPAVEVSPPNQNNQGLVVQEILKPTRGSDGRLNIKLQRGISVEGLVYDSNNTQKLIPARIVARRNSLIKGRPTIQTETSTEIGKRDNNREGYTLWLSKGHNYTFLVYPLPPYDYDYPPHVPPKTLKIDDHMKLNFALDGADRAVVVKGKVVGYGNSKLPTTVKIAGFKEEFSTVLRIRAFASDGLRTSTIGKTAPITGDFSFKVPGGTPGYYNIKVESAVDSVPMPTLECSKITLGIASSQQQNPQPTQTIVSPIIMPAFVYPKPYTVKVQDKDGKPVLGANVTFATELKVLGQNKVFDSCKATYERSSLTDATGKVELLLLPGTDTGNQEYTVSVRSPTSSHAASRYIPKYEVGPNAGSLAAIALEERHELKGQIYDKDNAVVTKVLVEANGIASNTTKVPVTSTSAISDDAGLFTIYVDPGVYNLALRPPESSGLPTFGKTIKVEQKIEGTSQFQVPLPSLVLGKVTTWDGKNALPQAMVRVYDLVPKTENPVTHTAALRASSVTDAQGLFNLVLADK